MAKKFIIDETLGFDSSSGERIRVFKVREVGQEAWDGTHVWLSNDAARCTNCSGPLTGMSASCKHATAVKRRYMNLCEPSLLPQSGSR
mgnify:CR=1 FL=1